MNTATITQPMQTNPDAIIEPTQSQREALQK
jgi:hypothetical protein